MDRGWNYATFVRSNPAATLCRFLSARIFLSFSYPNTPLPRENGHFGHFWVKKPLFPKYLKTGPETQKTYFGPFLGHFKLISGHDCDFGGNWPLWQKLNFWVKKGPKRGVLGSKNHFFPNISKLVGIIRNGLALESCTIKP